MYLSNTWLIQIKPPKLELCFSSISCRMWLNAVDRNPTLNWTWLSPCNRKYKEKLDDLFSSTSQLCFTCVDVLSNRFLPLVAKNGSGTTRLIKVLSNNDSGRKRNLSSLPTIYVNLANDSCWPCLASCPFQDWLICLGIGVLSIAGVTCAPLCEGWAKPFMNSGPQKSRR